MDTALSIGQVVISLAIITLVLLQQRGTGLGGAFGGGDGGFYAARRGIQEKLYWATIVLAALFVMTALANLVL